MNSRFTILLTLVCCGFFAAAQTTTVTITDADLVGGQTYNWTSDTEYLLDGLVYLEEDGVLNIEAGTVIKALGTGETSTLDNTSALIIARGATINAEGTAEAPIIFTADDDDVSDPDDLTAEDRGEWGGLIILGNAPIAFSDTENGIEGIDSDELRARYGGDDAEDNSGILRYVSIRHGGFPLSSGNEINGLTLGGVGSGTTIDFIEVFANLDDGIEWFGGTVDVKHATVAFCGDDGMDYDLGWRGRGQFWFVLQEPTGIDGTGRSGEHDGASPDGAEPFSQPTIYNATYIGIGSDGTAPDGDAADSLAFSVIFRDNAGGYYWNSIFSGFNGAAIAIEQRDDETPDSYDRFTEGDLALSNNIFEDFAFGTDPTDIFKVVNPDEIEIDDATETFATQMAEDNDIGASGIAGIGRTPNGTLDPRINSDGAALTGAAVNTDDDFFAQVTYRGAFGNTANWLTGWTALDSYGYLGDVVTPVDNSSANCITIADDDLVGGETYDWTSNNCYNLNGLVYLEADATLNIEAGTVIRGLSTNNISTGDNASALIITRGAQIFARGTATAPIIFTADDDDLDDPDDYTPTTTGEWGGVIILGNAPIAFSDTENGIEGIDSDELRARYGGSDAEDDSGVLNYVSIRHGGFALSGGNEINGLTLGGVGSGTEIDYVEVFANSDDGIEWFGGTVQVNHAAVAFCGDDGMDYDLGWRGGGQYWFVLQGASNPEGTGRAGEHDGASPDNATPFSQPTIYNATYIGIGSEETAQDGDAADDLNFSVIFRDNAGGFYHNSIFTDYNSAAIAIEDLPDTDADSYGRFLNDELGVYDSYFFNFGAGTEPSDLFLAVDANEVVVPASTAIVAAGFITNGNVIADPELNSIGDRDDDGGNLDPRVYAWGPAATGAPEAEAGFESVDYYGAFEPGAYSGNSLNWLGGWTALSSMMLTGDFTNSVGDVTDNGVLLGSPVPNPASRTARVNFELPKAGKVSLSVFDMLGRPVLRSTNQYAAGQQSEDLDVSNLANGNYIIIMDVSGSRLIQKMTVSH